MDQKRILLVEDKATFREPLMKALAREGYCISFADNGRLALQVLETETPDLLILDIGMPELDGLTLLAKLRNNPNNTDLPVIFLSARDDDITRHYAEKHNVIDYFIKAEFSMQSLLERVGKILSGGRSAEEL